MGLNKERTQKCCIGKHLVMYIDIEGSPLEHCKECNQLMEIR